jgi:hypothetical protein
MKSDAQNPKPKKAAKTLDDEIAAAQERLLRLQAQKREQERKALEKNQKAITAFLRTEKLDAVPIERWTAALAGLRKLLKVEEAKGQAAASPAAASPAAPSSERSANPAPAAKSEQGAAMGAQDQDEKASAVESAS